MRRGPVWGRRGISLLMVLLALVVIALLVVAALEGTTHQGRLALDDANLGREKMLADSTVALVIGQLQRASTTTGQAWISQPGLVQTFATGTARQPTASYKLYSAPVLVDTSGGSAFLAQDVPDDWSSHPELYTDLNAPARSGVFGASFYPILDPATFTSLPGVSVDPGHDVEMPVAWIYQLRDGTLGPASNGTKANPIVGRFAFWTDDESSKININTAIGGTFWETPHGNSADDVAWGAAPPVGGEFTRYPGHPAATTLAEVFNGLSASDLLALAPRYGAAGAPWKTDRLYASVDELCFGTGLNASNQRQPSSVTPAMLETDRFVLTADSRAPETTLLGEPRVAVWPVSASLSDPHQATAADRAIAAAVTVGGTGYYFQRSDPSSATADLAGNTLNTSLFNNLFGRADRDLPGSGVRFRTKYPGARWPQLMLEITDFIHSLNTIDPSPDPFQPFAPGDPGTLNGHAFVVPLRTTADPGSIALRGLGRCPTLSSLVLVVYVCGFGFTDGTSIDYDATPDSDGSNWRANFAVGAPNNLWKKVNAERLRAFIVPTFFNPACGYPEVNEDCRVEITGLDQLKVGLASSGPTGTFAFDADKTSDRLGDARQIPPAERAWGGEEGPLSWRAAAVAAENCSTYAFAGRGAFSLPLAPSMPKDPLTLGPSLPADWIRKIVIGGAGGAAVNLTVRLLDRNGHELQNLQVAWPTGGVVARGPTVNGECDQADTVSGGVAPSFYMNLANRIAQTGLCRHALIQAGDISAGMEAATDLRVISALASVPAACFAGHPVTLNPAQGGTHAHNLRFADGSSACFASGIPQVLAFIPAGSGTAQLNVHDWRDGSAVTYSWSTALSPSVPLSMTGAMMSATQPGDWSTGPGLAAPGATTALPDAGTTFDPATAWGSLSGGEVGAATQRAPNALVPSPVVLGSLPAGIDPAAPATATPWRTLLFCPFPAAGAAHPGLADPPDALILDNFWMPTVEPYALSTAFSTAGKINLNDGIAPFTYLHRHTALRALLHDLRVPAISASQAIAYKAAGAPLASIWQPLDEDATAAKFAAHGAYLSESEVCSIPLVPTGVDPSSLTAYWTGAGGGGSATGDDLRELPYALLYGRLTTRSNSYLVHVRAQVLQKLPLDPNQNVWNEGTDLVLGDWRGSYQLERYLDANAPAPTAGQPLGPYHFRTLGVERFTP